MTTEILSVSHSQVKTYRRCPKQWAYKYLDRLEPKEKKRAPYLGNWLHRALETHYKDGDWKIGHKEYLKEWNSLFDEEREELSKKYGPLPQAVRRIMRSYLWYWKNDGWKILAAEYEFEVLVGQFEVQGVIVQVYANGKVDLIVEDDEGNRWVVDHKSTGSIPDPGAFHAMDPQLMIYPVGVKEKFGKMAGITYNYIKSRPPTIPQLTKKTGAISRRKINTDYPTALRFLKDNGFDPADFSSFLKPLRKGSTFLKRYKLPREPKVTKRIMMDFVKTARDIYFAHFETNHVRNITKDCATQCAFHDLCRGELNGYDMSHLRKVRYTLREKHEHGADLEEGLEESEEEGEEIE